MDNKELKKRQIAETIRNKFLEGDQWFSDSGTVDLNERDALGFGISFESLGELLIEIEKEYGGRFRLVNSLGERTVAFIDEETGMKMQRREPIYTVLYAQFYKPEKGTKDSDGKVGQKVKNNKRFFERIDIGNYLFNGKAASGVADPDLEYIKIFDAIVTVSGEVAQVANGYWFAPYHKVWEVAQQNGLKAEANGIAHEREKMRNDVNQFMRQYKKRFFEELKQPLIKVRRGKGFEFYNPDS